MNKSFKRKSIKKKFLNKIVAVSCIDTKYTRKLAAKYKLFESRNFF